MVRTTRRKKPKVQTLLFVVLSTPDGKPIPMMDDFDILATFGSEIEASKVAGQNPLGQAYGYQIYPWVMGLK